jgi:cytochrome c1
MGFKSKVKLILWVLCIGASLLVAASQGVSSQTANAPIAITRNMPNGQGKRQTIKYCSNCHSMNLIVTQRKTKQQWLETVQVMVQKGIAGASEDDLLTIVDYLGVHYAPPRSSQEKPMTVKPGSKKKTSQIPATQASR